jgi:hypothetical protein
MSPNGNGSNVKWRIGSTVPTTCGAIQQSSKLLYFAIECKEFLWRYFFSRINDLAVILGKNRNNANSKSKSLSESNVAQFNVIPQLRRGMNRGYGSIRRPGTSSSRTDNAQDESRGEKNDVGENDDDAMDVSSGRNDSNDIAVEPLNDEKTEDGPSSQTFKSSITLKIKR